MGEFYFCLVVVILMALSVGVMNAWVVAWWRPRKMATNFARQGVRGPRYIPFIGNMKEMASLMLADGDGAMPFSHNIVPRVLSFYHHLKKTYGRTFLIWFGLTPRLTVSDPDLIREILVTKSELYEKNETHPLIRQLEGDGLLCLKGDKWAQHRRIIGPTFHTENRKVLIPEIGRSAVDMMERWKQQSPELDSGEKEVDVAHCFQELTQDIIARAAFGAGYDDGKSVCTLQTQLMFLAAEAFHTLFLHGYRFIPTKRNMKRWRLTKNIQKSLMDLISRRKVMQSERFSRSQDLLSRLMASGENTGSEGPLPVGVSVQDIVEECKTFFFAGTQTTSNLLTWTAVLLASHPDWQEAVRGEIIQHCGTQDIPTRPAIAKLKTGGALCNNTILLAAAFSQQRELLDHSYSMRFCVSLGFSGGVLEIFDCRMTYLALRQQQSSCVKRPSMENALYIIKERKTAWKTIEDALPVIEETQALVHDTENFEALCAELRSLKDALQSEKQKTYKAQKAYAETERRNENLVKKLEDSERKVGQLQDSLQRLENKLTNLNSENEILWQRVLGISPTTKASTIWQEKSVLQDLTHAVASIKDSEFEEMTHQSLNDKNEVDLLIKNISQNLGFKGSMPIAAFIIHKCILHWRTFELPKTNVFDHIIQTISSAISKEQDNNDLLAYWLCNSCTLLLLLQQTLTESRQTATSPQPIRLSTSSSARMHQNSSIPPVGTRKTDGLKDFCQVKEKFPALLFKKQLIASIAEIYGVIRDNIKKEISPIIGMCIQAPRISRANSLKGSRSQANTTVQRALTTHWQIVIKCLNNFLELLRANYVPSFLIQKIFIQTFSFINVQLFNSLLLRRECCSLSNGEYVKAGLTELEQWCHDSKEEYVGSAIDELRHIRQAVEFLVTHQKPKKTLEEITKDLCPVLSIQQLYKISIMYCDNKYGTHSVSSEVIANMQAQMTEELDEADGTSFLLEADSSISFSIDEVTESMQKIDTTDINPLYLICEDAGFGFLLEHRAYDQILPLF